MKDSGATVAITRRTDLLSAWAAHHRRVARSTMSELLASPLSSVMTWLMIGIALGLPAILYLVLQNVATISGDWGGKPRISIYLEEQVSLAQGRRAANLISGNAEVEQVTFISADDALVDFQARSGFGDVLDTLQANPLPHVIDVVPLSTEPLRISGLITELEAMPGVDHVSVDLQWLERLNAILVFAERLVSALAVVLCVGVVLVMGNTIRLSIENRRQEIEVVKLVGGTDSFVRRPFLYLGFWYGIGGALFAFLLLQVSLLILSTPVEMLAQSYRDDFALRGPGLPGILLLLASGGILGVLGALLAVSRHLADIEPGRVD